MTVLVDDVRGFRDGQQCRIARSSSSGVLLLEELREERIEDLWLDHDLDGADTIWPVIRHLETGYEEGRPYDLGLVHIHAAQLTSWVAPSDVQGTRWYVPTVPPANSRLPFSRGRARVHHVSHLSQYH